MMLQFIAGTLYAGSCIHGIAAHSKILFNNTDLTHGNFPNMDAYSKIGNNTIFLFEIITSSLDISPGLYYCVERFARIFWGKIPGAYHLIANILIYYSIKFYYCQ